MKRAIVLGLSLLLTGVALASGSAYRAQGDDGFQIFWARFKSAVAAGHADTVAQLSQFPIGISSPAANIRSRAELRPRFREVFAGKINAAECFARNEPSRDTENRDMFTVACRYDNGGDAAAYQFEHTKAGWKFTHFQLTTTCRCR